MTKQEIKIDTQTHTQVWRGIFSVYGTSCAVKLRVILWLGQTVWCVYVKLQDLQQHCAVRLRWSLNTLQIQNHKQQASFCTIHHITFFVLLYFTYRVIRGPWFPVTGPQLLSLLSFFMTNWFFFVFCILRMRRDDKKITCWSFDVFFCFS